MGAGPDGFGWVTSPMIVADAGGALFPWEGSGPEESSFGNFEFEKLVDNQNEYVHHMPLDVRVWTFRRDARNQGVSTNAAAEARGSLGCVLWAVVAASVPWGED